MSKVSVLGFDVLEISCAVFRDIYITKEQLTELREYAKEKGLVLIAGYGLTKAKSLYSEDPEAARRVMIFFRDLFPELQLVDIHILGGGLCSYWPANSTVNNDKQGDRAGAIRDLRELPKIAGECDVVLGMGVLNHYERYIPNTCEKATDFVDETGSGHVKIILDISHMNIEETNMADAIHKVGDRLRRLHLRERNCLVSGKGSLPWAEIGQALRDINYRGAAVVEPFIMQGGTIGSEIKVWRGMVPDPSEEVLDGNAKGALEFCRRAFGI